MAKVEIERDLLLRKRARRRLIGSIVLVIIAIVVLPIILERAPKQERKEIEIIIPSENLLDNSSTEIAPENSDLGTGSNTSKEVITETEEIAAKKSDLLVKPAQKKKEQAGRGAGSEGDSENSHKDKKPIVTIEKFVVQLGAFSDSAKAKHQQLSLKSNGIKKAYTETIKNKNTEVTRVRVGPFSTREAAEKEQKKLRELGVNGVVMSK